MRHIGIVDVTTVGSTICQLAIVQKAAEQDPCGKHPEFSVNSISFDRYKQQILARDWDALGDIVLSSIEKLKAAGAEFIIMPCNTLHYGFERIERLSPLPVLNIVELSTQACKDKAYKKVAALGTTATTEGGLFDTSLEAKGIEAVVIPDDLKKKIDTFIMEEIIPIKVRPETTAAIAAQLKQIDCDAFILGCTELPEVFNPTLLGKPCIDTTRLLGFKALEYARG